MITITIAWKIIVTERNKGEEAAKRRTSAVKRNKTMRKWARTTIAVFLILVVSTSATAEAEEEEDEEDEKTVIVQTAYGKLEGVRRSHRIPIDSAEIVTKTVDEFLGIPYATPPTGDHRFRGPVKPRAWPGVRPANAFGAACPQRIYVSVNARYTKQMDEDCLYLNIYSPYLDAEKKRRSGNPSSSAFPVMLFVHGGSYLYGTGNIYNGTVLAMLGVLIVTVNYRLDTLGFLASGTQDLPGNYGLLDQIQAMEWIQQNIRSFRGDPSRVTIFGSSAGGASVGLAFLSPLAQGLFHRVIAESGTANALWATNTDKTEERLMEEVNFIAQSQSCRRSTMQETIACLRLVPWTELLHNEKLCQVLSCSEIDPVMKPVTDGRVLTDRPQELLRLFKFNRTIQYMTGTVRDEFGTYAHNYSEFYMWKEVDSYLSRKYDSAVRLTIAMSYIDWSHQNTYPGHLMSPVKIYDRAQVLSDLGLLAPTIQMASDIASAPGTDTYVYYLDLEESYHSVELNYVFGLPFIGGVIDEYNKEFSPETSSSVMKRLSLTIMKMWTSFAKHGNPTPGAIRPSDAAATLRWTRFDPNVGNCLYIKSNSTDAELQMVRHFRADKTALWNVVVPAIASSTRECGKSSCSGIVYDGTKIAVLIGIVAALSILLVFMICFNLCALRHGNVRFGRQQPTLGK